MERSLVHKVRTAPFPSSLVLRPLCSWRPLVANLWVLILNLYVCSSITYVLVFRCTWIQGSKCLRFSRPSFTNAAQLLGYLWKVSRPSLVLSKYKLIIDITRLTINRSSKPRTYLVHRLLFFKHQTVWRKTDSQQKAKIIWPLRKPYTIPTGLSTIADTQGHYWMPSTSMVSMSSHILLGVSPIS